MDGSVGRKSFKRPTTKLYVLDEDFYPGKIIESKGLMKFLCFFLDYEIWLRF